MKIEGMVAVVTGGGSGLGAATARQLAAKGAKVAVLDLNAPAAIAVADELGGVGIGCNVTDENGVQSALEAVTSSLGAPRILVNCAGIGGAQRIVGKEGPHPLDAFRNVVEVNLVGTFNVIRLFAAQAQDLDPLEGGERGVIVNTSSVAAFEGQIGQSAYSATKGGIASMTLPIARDLSRAGIRVMTIAPGIFKTPMLAELPEEAQDSLGAQVPFPPRLGDPSEYGDLVCHIVTNQMLNGEVIRLDGAIRMGPK
jgi:NAD(P)-dependent dehydrogenase (short-subunit alcohol dehydrogenase family)